MRTSIPAVAALAAIANAQNTTIVDVAAIAIPVPTSVFVLPIVYVTEEGAPTGTATTLALAATATSDPSATKIFDSAADAPAAISSAASAAADTATGLTKRDDGACLHQPLGIAHVSVPDTPAAFAADAYYSAQAVAAQTLQGFTQIYSNYMGFTLMSSYDVATCLSKCSAISGCNSVNIYSERDPILQPAAACLNPPSTIQIKCVFWGGIVGVANANNYGQYREDFQVLIAGSNGYTNSSYALAIQNKLAAAATTSAVASTATDTADNVYTINYSSDSTQGAYANAQASASYADCMTACDNDSSCSAFTYIGGKNGVGSGTCWLKTALGAATSSGANVVSGVRSVKAIPSALSLSQVIVTSSASSIASTSSTSTTTSSPSSYTTSSSTSTSTSSSSHITSSSSSSSVSLISTSSLSFTSSSVAICSGSTVPSTTSHVRSLATSSSTTLSATTLATSTRSATSTSSSTTSSASSTLSTPFVIALPNNGGLIAVISGQNGYMYVTSDVTKQTRFQIDSTNGALLEYTGTKGLAANVPQPSFNYASYNPISFNSVGGSNSYLSCGLNGSNKLMYCKANSVSQYTFTCYTNGYTSIQLGSSIPFGCIQASLYYNPASY